MRILFYDAKRYDIESFNGEKANYPQIELEYLETDLNVRTAKLAGGYDHNWVLNGSGFRKAASAESEETGIKMEVYTDLPGIQFYSGNFLAGAKGKEGAVYGKGCGICFETQYFPDAIHKDNFESPITKAGEVYDTTTTYRFC